MARKTESVWRGAGGTPMRAIVAALCGGMLAVAAGCSQDRATSAAGTPRDEAAPTVAPGGPIEHSAPVERVAQAPRADVELVPPHVTPADSWPVFRGNELSTGVSAASLPDEPALLWKREFPDGAFEASPVIAGGAIYVGGLDGFFYALDLETGDERWKFPTDFGFYAAAAVRDGRVFVGDADGRVFCLDAETGEAIWGYETNGEINSGLNFFDRFVLVGSQDGTLYCFATEDGALEWEYQIEDQIRCCPTVVDNRAFLAGCDMVLHVIDLERGERVGEIDIEAPTGSTPAAAGDYVYFGTEGETFFCIDWRRAEIIWTYRNIQRSLPFRSSAALTSELVLFGGRDKILHAVDRASGQERWSFPTRARVDSSPVVVGERVYFGSADGRLYGLDVASGGQVWQFETGGGFSASPAVASDRMVIGNDDGVLFCFGTASGD